MTLTYSEGLGKGKWGLGGYHLLAATVWVAGRSVAKTVMLHCGEGGSDKV